MKVPAETMICPDCRLNYKKFNEATNQEAKEAIRQGEKDNVLMRKGCPPDVNKIKLLLLAIFFGMFGVHHYYVGRYKTGLIYTCFFVVGITNTILSMTIKNIVTSLVYQVFSWLVLGWGIVLFMWIFDIANIILNKFKIPVSRSM